mmetsp:Transcript_24753/g.63067  ORF Transcript_24753/g.63067 Transcript_24753/m.63067 type:complete len:90 (+) Transcript_24753:156-425(+)
MVRWKPARLPSDFHMQRVHWPQSSIRVHAAHVPQGCDLDSWLDSTTKGKGCSTTGVESSACPSSSAARVSWTATEQAAKLASFTGCDEL